MVFPYSLKSHTLENSNVTSTPAIHWGKVDFLDVAVKPCKRRKSKCLFPSVSSADLNEPESGKATYAGFGLSCSKGDSWIRLAPTKVPKLKPEHHEGSKFPLNAQRLELKVRDNQSKPSYKPSPVVAHADLMYHWLLPH